MQGSEKKSNNDACVSLSWLGSSGSIPLTNAERRMNSALRQPPLYYVAAIGIRIKILKNDDEMCKSRNEQTGRLVKCYENRIDC